MAGVIVDFSAPASFSIAYGNVTVGTSANASFTLTGSFPMQQHQLTSAKIIATTFAGTGAAAYANVPTIIGIFMTSTFTMLTGTIRFTPSGVGPFSATLNVHYDVFVGGVDQNTNTPTFHTLTLSGTGVAATGGGGGVGEVPAVLQSFRRELVPVNSQSTGIVLAYFDETNFNDPIDGSTYIYKAEDIIADRMPTVRRVIFTYIDQGIATVGVTITGSDDNGNVVSNTVNVVIGNATPTFSLLTAFADIGISCFRPQLSISRAAGGGPIAISTAMMVGTVETEVTL